MEIVTRTPEETEQLGERLAPLLLPGTVLALHGELASGKTCFVRGLAKHFAGRELVHSPTFTLVNEYGSGPRLYHLDLYRLKDDSELIELGYEEIFGGEDICAVEWAERAENLLPARRVEVHFGHVQGDQRRIVIQDLGGCLRAGLPQSAESESGGPV